VVQVPVGHRSRLVGSRIPLRQPLVQVVEDLLGVAWLLRRPIRYRVDSLTYPSDQTKIMSNRLTEREFNDHSSLLQVVGFVGQGFFTAGSLCNGCL